MTFRVNPGQEDSSVLELQEYHVSQHIWQGHEDRHLHVRCAQKTKHMDPPARILPYLEQAGFLGVAHMGYCSIDHSLITALVERWRPETHTFHMPTGECTITLEDIGIISGLPIDGAAVTGLTHRTDWLDLCDHLLGIDETSSLISGARIDMTYLWQPALTELTEDDDDDYVQQRARHYILRLLGGFLCPDHSGNYVDLMFLPLLEDFDVAGTYSWGSAVLAYLYRELCQATDYKAREIGGACILLQYWAWYRFPQLVPTLADHVQPDVFYVANRGHLRPLGWQWRKHKVLSDTVTGVLEYYRRFFDQLKNDEIIWQPYTDENVASLPPLCVAGRDIALAVVPLIFFHIVEWHQPDRVMRQFGFDQPIPVRPCQLDSLHSITLAVRNNNNWSATHVVYIATWDRRRDKLVRRTLLQAPLTSRFEYMRWYKRITRRWISLISAFIGNAADIAEHLYGSTTDATVRECVKQILHSLQEHDRIILEQLRPAPAADDIPGPPEESSEQGTRRRRRIGLSSTWTRLRHSEDSVSTSQHTTRPPTTTIAPIVSATCPATQQPPTYYPPYPPYSPYPYLPYPYPLPSYPPYPYPPQGYQPYPYPPQGYPPYPYSPPGYPSYPYSPPSYPPNPSQSGPSSDPSHKPLHSDVGPSH